MLLLEHFLGENFGVDNQAERERQSKRLETLCEIAAKAGRKVSFVYQCVQRFTKRCLKFIRTLRAFLISDDPLCQIAERLNALHRT